MGIAASLFYSTSNPENTLDWRIRPSDEQYEQQQERWRDLAENHLVSDLKERSGYPISWWLQGSYKFGTQVRPADLTEEFDIDLGIYFRWEGRATDGTYGPGELKGFMRASLLDYAADEDNEADNVADPKDRCERLHFKPDFHIDVPCYHLDPARDARRLATEDNQWEDSDPKAIYRWWKDTFDDTDLPRLRRLVRYFKMWAALKFDNGSRPSSILLTVLAGEAWDGLDHENLKGDDEYLTATASSIIFRFSRSHRVPNPADKDEDLNRLDQGKSDAFVEELRALLDVGERALKARTKTEAAEIWSEAFEHFFPLPEDAEDETAVLKEASRELVPFFDPQIVVEAQPKKSDGRVFRGVNQLPPIPRGCDVTFKLGNAHQLPAGATLSWVVRNKGDEAEDVNDLGHLAGTGTQASENSAYKGTHFMDLTVRLRGRIIGRRRIAVTITGMFMPLRNPKRPAWTKFRSNR